MDSSNHQEHDDFGERPTIVIAWDPDVLSESEYAELVLALGDIARAYGGDGVRRLDALPARVLLGVYA
jgi:hypothetical protein